MNSGNQTRKPRTPLYHQDIYTKDFIKIGKVKCCFCDLVYYATHSHAHFWSCFGNYWQAFERQTQSVLLNKEFYHGYLGFPNKVQQVFNFCEHFEIKRLLYKEVQPIPDRLLNSGVDQSEYRNAYAIPDVCYYLILSYLPEYIRLKKAQKRKALISLIEKIKYQLVNGRHIGINIKNEILLKEL